MKSLKTLVALLVLTLAAHDSFGVWYWYKKPFSFGRQLSRYSLGANVIMASAEFTGRVPVNNGNIYLRDTTVTRLVPSALSTGFSLGLSLPLARLGKISTLAMSYEVQYNSVIYRNFYQAYDRSISDFQDIDGVGEVLSSTTQIAAPISLDLKVGSDALAKRATRLGFSVGAGVMPMYNATTVANDNSDISFNYTKAALRPFAKGEFSFFWVACFRVKVYYTLGEIMLMENKSVLKRQSYGDVKLNQKSNMIISVQWLPFSSRWATAGKNHAWDNEYDSEMSFSDQRSGPWSNLIIR